MSAILQGSSTYSDGHGSSLVRAASGEVVLAGANPTVVACGLRQVLGATASIKASSTPGDDPIVLTVDYEASPGDGFLSIYAWKTNGSDPTLVDSTNNTAVVSWIAIGV